MTYEQVKHLKARACKRKCGCQSETFEQMVEVLRCDLERRGKRGGQCKLSGLRPTAVGARELALNIVVSFTLPGVGD